ncbi:MAG: hypothetical protein AB7F53_08235 [Nitrososphaeraceae archaeon]
MVGTNVCPRHWSVSPPLSSSAPVVAVLLLLFIHTNEESLSFS